MRPADMVSRERNFELAMILAGLGFIAIAWRALDASQFVLPSGTQRIVTQFAISALAGNVGLRIVAPHASAQAYALAFVAFAWLGTRYQFLRRYTYTAGAAALAILVVTGVFGTTINGARLWITIGGQTIQTTELIKLFVVLFLAGYLAERGTVLATPTLKFGGRTYSSLPYLVPLLGLLLAAIAALALLKDLGSIA